MILPGEDTSSSGTAAEETVTASETKAVEETTEAEIKVAEEITEAEIEDAAEGNRVEQMSSADPRDEGVEEQALKVHGISLDTIKKVVTKYRYYDDTEYTSTFSDYEFLFYFEDSVEEYNYKIKEDGYGMIEWEAEETLNMMRMVLSDSELSVMTVEEANALSDDDLIGVYGMCYNYELYQQDDPGKEDSNYWEVTKDNVVDVIRNAQEGDYIHISNGIVSLPINSGNNIIIYPSDGLSYDPSNCFRLVVTDLDMRFSNGDHLEIYGTFDYQDDIAWIIPESVSYLN